MLPRAPAPDGMLLHRFSVKPGHLDAYLELWPEVVELRIRHGFAVHQAYLETHAEPKITWLYSHPEPMTALEILDADPVNADLTDRAAPHVFRNGVIRPVRTELLAAPPWPRPGDDDRGTSAWGGRIVVMRRYAITGSWAEFLAVWRRIVPVRERYDFRCLFAVADEPKDMFTWAFDMAGSWERFVEAQRPYYRDPDRVALRGVFDYMADYTITQATPLPLPSPGGS